MLNCLLRHDFEKKKIKQLLYLIAAIICTLVVLVLSVLPPQSLSAFNSLKFEYLDKVVHIFMYAILAFLWFKTLNREDFTRSKSILIVLAVSTYGVLMEFVQLLIKGRSFEWEDMFSNIAGAFLGIVIASLKWVRAS